MTSATYPFRWVPALLVGLCAAIAAEVAVASLLYSGPGLLRSLTVVLAVEAAALGAGLWTAPGRRPDLMEALRRRWILGLGAFLLATLFSAFWSVVTAVGGTALGQGLGLAFMAALPMYAIGGILGTLGTAAEAEASGSSRMVAGPAGLGAALGFAATGAFLPQTISPASLLLVSLVLLSGAGVVYGLLPHALGTVQVRACRLSGIDEVRVEDHFLATGEPSARVLLEGKRLRRWVLPGDGAAEAWDVTACAQLLASGAGPEAILLIGGGVSTVPAVALRERPTLRIDILERSLCVVEMGKEHFETGLTDSDDGRVVLHVGNLEEVLAAHPGPYGLVVLDTAALAPDEASALSPGFGASVIERVSSDGYLILGPGDPPGEGWVMPEGWSFAAYTRPVPAELERLGSRVPEREVLWLASPSAELPAVVGGFQRHVEGQA